MAWRMGRDGRDWVQFWCTREGDPLARRTAQPACTQRGADDIIDRGRRSVGLCVNGAGRLRDGRWECPDGMASLFSRMYARWRTLYSATTMYAAGAYTLTHLERRAVGTGTDMDDDAPHWRAGRLLGLSLPSHRSQLSTFRPVHPIAHSPLHRDLRGSNRGPERRNVRANSGMLLDLHREVLQQRKDMPDPGLECPLPARNASGSARPNGMRAASEKPSLSRTHSSVARYLTEEAEHNRTVAGCTASQADSSLAPAPPAMGSVH